MFDWINPPARLPPNTLHRLVFSERLGTDVGYCLYRPRSARGALPTVYWLHGRGGDERSGLETIPLRDRAIELGRVAPHQVVLLNGGGHTMFCDSTDGRVPVESFLVHELLPHIERSSSAMVDGQGRLLEGVSMGGFGAIKMLCRYPELFARATAYAGAFHTATSLAGSRKTIFSSVFGSDPVAAEQETPGYWARHNAVSLRGRARMRLVVGLSDPTLEMNRSFHRTLSELRISHDYEEIPGLGHDLMPYYRHAGLTGYRFSVPE